MIGGIKSLIHAQAGDNFSTPTDLGALKSDTSFESTSFDENQTTQGETVYAGYQDTLTVHVLDLTKRAVLLEAMKTMTRLDFRATLADGNTFEMLDILPQVGRVIYPVSSGSRAYFILTLKKQVIE